MIKKQRGVTLIELLIGMVLGLALISGLSQLFIQSQTSFKLQRNLSDMTDDAVFALEDLKSGLLLAGYSADNNPVTNYIGSNNTNNDELFYSFKLGNSSQRNNSICLKGSSTNIGGTINVDIFIENSNDLSCVSGTATQPLIQNVEKLVFKYGIRNGTSPNYRFYYTDKTGATGNWQNVFAVKVFLVMRSADDNLVHNQTGYKIDGVQQLPVPTNNRLYKVFSKTIFLRAAP